jgi:hypothetical protein
VRACVTTGIPSVRNWSRVLADGELGNQRLGRSGIDDRVGRVDDRLGCKERWAAEDVLFFGIMFCKLDVCPNETERCERLTSI